MDLEAFERVEATFRAFHAEFAPDFGRKQWREHSLDYLQGLLVQSQERRNAENMAEALPVSARSLQRFLTDARWEDEAVIVHLQEYLAPRLIHPRAVFAVDSSGFPKQGRKSVGVARQYCGAVGKIANCQVGVFLAYVGPRGRALVDKRLFLPEEWTDDPARCDAAGVPQEKQGYRSETELALEMLQQVKARGHLVAQWVTGDDTYGKSPAFRDGVEALGLRYVLEIPSNPPVWPLVVTFETPPYRGKGPRPKPRPVVAERQEVRERAARLAQEGWREITVAAGTQGPRPYRFAAERVRETREGEPGKVPWVVYRENVDGSEPRYFFAWAPEETPLSTLAWVAAARWPIETELETEKSDIGLDEYEVRRWAGWHHHITLCLLASAFLLTLQQEWGEKDAPPDAPPGVPGGARAAAAAALRAGGTAGVVGRDPRAQRAIPAVSRQAAGSAPPGDGFR